ncbi:hypothetical protein KC348_g17651 [Hortaea werneckii]|nr:hypothetical protein KC348_g17651 [Hortaea werneckii]
MSVDPEIESKCKEISTNYSACDVSDALLKLKIPQAGFLPDILPLNSNNNPNPTTIAAPLSTVLFVPKPQASPSPSSPPPFATPIPEESNILPNKHWTDLPGPGTIVLLQQPQGQICAVCGDILATRLKVRGVKGIVADGRQQQQQQQSQQSSGGGKEEAVQPEKAEGKKKGGGDVEAKMKKFLGFGRK